MAVADTRSSLVVVKAFTYKDELKEWSNRYHFTGALTLTPTEWTALADAVVAAERLTQSGNVLFERVVGNDASTASPTNPHGDAVFEKTYSGTGSGSFGSDGRLAPGNGAAVLRWKTDARTGKNHPIYLFNYFHGVYMQDADRDKVEATQLGTFNAYGEAWVDGFSDGSGLRHRCGPRGAVGSNPITHQYISHRDFPN